MNNLLKQQIRNQIYGVYTKEISIDTAMENIETFIDNLKESNVNIKKNVEGFSGELGEAQ